jgi:hypothetical protein
VPVLGRGMIARDAPAGDRDLRIGLGVLLVRPVDSLRLVDVAVLDLDRHRMVVEREAGDVPVLDHGRGHAAGGVVDLAGQLRVGAVRLRVDLAADHLEGVHRLERLVLPAEPDPEVDAEGVVPQIDSGDLIQVDADVDGFGLRRRLGLSGLGFFRLGFFGFGGLGLRLGGPAQGRKQRDKQDQEDQEQRLPRHTFLSPGGAGRPIHARLRRFCGIIPHEPEPRHA